METFLEYCKNYILDNIDYYVGDEEYLCDFGFKLTEGPNADGSFTYSSSAARDYLHEWYEDAAQFYEYEMYQFGSHSHNPFDNPEAYMCCMVVEGVRQIIDRAIDDLGYESNWNNKVTITKRMANRIKKYVKEFYDDIF